MQRVGHAKMSMLLVRKVVNCQWKSHYGKLTESRHQLEKSKNSSNTKKSIESLSWVPHPRSGIYFPEGHEQVMDDVPANAALCTEKYWLRNVDGVARPSPDTPTDHYFRKYHGY